MKILLLAIVLCGYVESSAQWHEFSMPSNVLSCSVPDSQSGFCCRPNSTFFTLNGGLKWYGPTTKGDRDGPRFQIVFPTREKGFLFSDDEIAVSIDSARSWTRIFESKDLVGHQDIRAGTFIDGDIGFFVGYDVYGRTTDGGQSWTMGFPTFHSFVVDGNTKITTSTGGNGGYYLVGTHLIDVGYSVWQNIGHYTADGGNSWKSIGLLEYLGSFHLVPHAIYFVDEQHGFIGGYRETKTMQRDEELEFKDSRLIITTDGGDSWDKPEFVFPHTVKAIGFVNPDVGFVGDEFGGVYQTVDGGKTWTLDLQIPDSNAVKYIHCTEDGRVHVFGNGYYFRKDVTTSLHEPTHNDADSDGSYTITPNPVQNTFRVAASGATGEAVRQLIVYDVYGSSVLTRQVLLDQDIDCSTLPSGLYIARIEAGSSFESIRFIVNR